MMRFRRLPAVPACVLMVAALGAVDHGDRWWRHHENLGGDNPEERLPGTEGHRKAAQYVAGQLEKAGLLPGGKSGYLQPVKIRSRRLLEKFSNLALLRDGVPQPLALGEDAIVDMDIDPAPMATAPLVFIGYGLTIPELHYDDLEGLDLHGKIAVILGGGPSDVPGPLRAHFQSAEERHKLLRQRAGVFGIVTIQNPKSMAIPWSRVAGNRLEAATSAADPAFEQDDELELSVVFNPQHADKLFEGSGHTFRELLALADAGKALPRFPLATSLQASIAVERTEGESQNVIGVLPGSDPALKNEYVMLSAHLDHRGAGKLLPVDRANSDATDDASGAASLLDIAESLHESASKPRRSLLFVFLTGEEKGLLGSLYFGQYPLVGAGNIVADLRVDLCLPFSPLEKITVYGLNESDLGAKIRAAGARGKVRILDDPDPQWDVALRSDQYSLIHRGVPAVAFKVGYEKAAAKDSKPRAVDKSAASRFDGMVMDLAITVANQPKRPQWLPASYFKRFSR